MANWMVNNHCKEKMDKWVRGSELRRYEMEVGNEDERERERERQEGRER